MPKIADKYLQVDPWKVVEEGFDPGRNRVSESIFSLGNEYMGVRGYPEEGYGGDTLLGSYFNGLFEESPVTAHYKGIIKSLRFMVNAVDWLHTRITLDGETLDLAESRFSDFRRELDFRTGIYTREFVWHTASGKNVQLTFERLVSMKVSHLGAQRITFTPLNFSGTVQVRTGLDLAVLHEDQQRYYWKELKRRNRDRGDFRGDGEYAQPVVFRFPRGCEGCREQSTGAGGRLHRTGTDPGPGSGKEQHTGQTRRQRGGEGPYGS